MNKVFRKMFCMITASVLTVTSLPLSVSNASVKEADTLEKGGYEEGEVLVVSKEAVGLNGSRSISDLDRTTAKIGAEVEDSSSIELENEDLEVSLIKSDKYSTEELMEKYRDSTGVQIVQPNYKYHMSSVDSGSYDNMLWGIDNQGQNAGTMDLDINSDSEKVRMAAGEEGKEKVVAIIDTGVDYTHSELSSYIWNNPYAGYLRGVHGYDFVNDDSDPLDDNGHGTHCAGIVSSVMNGDNIKIMPLKFLDDSGYGDTYGAIQAYYYIYTAQSLGVNVVAVNNSWGGELEEGDEILNSMINLVGKNGAVSVCAAGNESQDTAEYYTTPACGDSPYIISVAASNERGDLASFSNYGKDVDVAAPGTSILSSVSYNCFNPSVYKEENGIKDMCSIYQDFNGNLVKPDVTGVLNYSNTDDNSICYALEQSKSSFGVQEVVLTHDDYFGENGEEEQSLEWSIKGAEVGDIYTLHLPYEQETSDTPVHVNMMFKIQSPDTDSEPDSTDILGNMGSLFTISDSEIDSNGRAGEANTLGYMAIGESMNYWSQITAKKDKSVKVAEKRAISLVIAINRPGDYVLHIDDFAISKSNSDENDLGKTAYYEGTSMATPYVTGAVAALANAYPEDSIDKRIGRIKGAVRKTEGLEGKVASGGLLDLSKADSPEPVFEKVIINDSGQLEIQGSFLGSNAKVIVNGEESKIVSATAESIVLEGDYYNKKLEITVKIADKTFSDKCFFAKGNSPKEAAEFPYVVNEAGMVCSGDTMYIVSSNGEVYSFNGESFADAQMADIMMLGGSLEDADIFNANAGEIVIGSAPVCIGDELYAVIMLNTNFSTEAVLAKFNKSDFKWEKVTNLPDGYYGLEKQNNLYSYLKPILASYNGDVYLIGGFDTNKKAPVNDVYRFDVKNGKWYQEVSMPEVRFAGMALQTGDKLVVTLGGNGTDKCPSNLIFDGDSWTSSEEQLNIFEMRNLSYYEYDSDGNKNAVDALYADGSVGITADGLIYAGCKADGLADIFSYNLNLDKYIASGYCLDKISDSRKIFASCLGGKLYIISVPELDLLYPGEEDGSDSGSYFSQVYYVEVEDGRCCIKQPDSTEGGKVSGLGMYMPGSSTKIKVKPDKNYYLKSLKINGKEVNVKKTGVSVTVSNITSDVDVQAEFGAYVTKLIFDKKKLSIGAGRKVSLGVRVLPENALNKKLSYKSANTNVVTVDSKGNIKANKNATGKSTEITVTAKDRKTVVAKCSVKVVKPVNVKKITLSAAKGKNKIKAGKTLMINASVSPKNADMKDLSWYSDNTEYATVANGKVTAKKAGIGKTVTITARATDGSKVKASIKLRIVK